MSQRTLADAARQLQALAEVLPARTHAALVEELDEAQATAREAADRALQSRLVQAEELSDKVRDGQRHLADSFRKLAERANLADESAKALAKELDLLRRDQRTLSRKTDEIGHTVERLWAIDNDPIGWVDTALYESYPAIRPTFSF